MKILKDWLERNATEKNYLFTPQDLKLLHPNLSATALKTILSRAVNANLLERVCRGLYAYKKPANGLLLFHAAAYLRRDTFNYISLETALSNVGIISQVPMQWISIMSSGRSNIISCANFGTIEFIHTSQKPVDLMNQLIYDKHCRLWRANIALAIRDMKITQRNCDLIDWELVHELIR